MIKKNKLHVNLANARVDAQRRVMEQIASDGVCPFCEKNLKKYHKLPIEIENPHWILTKNMYPYKNTSLHILFILKRHVTHLDKLTNKEWLSLYNIFSNGAKKFKIISGGFLIRFGNTMRTGGTVEHLHGHIIVGKNKNNPVSTRIA